MDVHFDHQEKVGFLSGHHDEPGRDAFNRCVNSLRIEAIETTIRLGKLSAITTWVDGI